MGPTWTNDSPHGHAAEFGHHVIVSQHAEMREGRWLPPTISWVAIGSVGVHEARDFAACLAAAVEYATAPMLNDRIGRICEARTTPAKGG